MPIWDDPFAFFADHQQQAQAQQGPVPKLEPFTPQEEDSKLAQVARVGTSGLSWIAGGLDKLFGGRAIRGALAGRPRELLSAIPFSDTVGLTEPEQRTSGEDLAKQFGLLDGAGQKGYFELRDLVGPAIEAGLDPATYLLGPGAALTKAGQAAKKIGAIPASLAGRIAGHGSVDAVAQAMGRSVPEAVAAASGVGVDINDLIGKPLGGFAATRMPFGDPISVFGTGPTAQRVAQKLGGWYDKALYSSPGRVMSAAFDPAVQGALHGDVQRNWRLEANAARARDVQSRLDALGVAEPLLSDPSMHNLSTAQGPLRGMVEGTRTFPGPYTHDVLDALDAASGRLTSLNQGNLARAQAAGLRVEDLDSIFGTNYAARSPTPLPQTSGVQRGLPREQFSHQLYSGIGPGLRRDEILDVPGGTDMINQMVRDPRIGTSARTLPQQGVESILANEFIKPNPARLATLRQMEASATAAGQTLPPQLAQELAMEAHKEKIVPALASYLGGLDPRRLDTGLFGNDVISDTLRAQEGINKGIGRANVATRTLADRASVGAAGQPGMVPLKSVLTDLKLHPDRAGQNILDLLNQRGGSPVTNPNMVHVPEDVAAAVRALSPKLKSPDYLQGPLGLFDQLTNLTRTHLTAEWPGKHVRDLTTGMAQNLQAGSPGAATFGAPAIKTLREGGTVPGLAAEMGQHFPYAGLPVADADATVALAKELFSQQAAGRGMGGLAREGIAPTNPIADTFAHAIPGVKPEEGVGGILSNWIPRTAAEANPLNVAGWGGRTTSEFAPVAAGRQLGDLFDDMGRGGLYADLRRQGYTADAAGRAVSSTQFDYQLTDFERNVMRRLFPFYSWMRQVTPQQIGMLAEAPGGLSGQGIRLADDFRQQRGFEPPYLAGTLAVPVGQEGNGTQRYLTKLDAPWENPLEMLTVGPRGPQYTAMGMLSMLNPLIKGPLEFATGKQFYSGRDMSELYSRTGVPALDQIIMNSPAARALTTAGTLADPRKDPLTTLFNLGTGARLSDVDMEKQRNQATMDYIRDSLKGADGVKNFSEISVSPQDIPKLSQEEQDMLRLYRGMQKRAADEAKKKKQGVQI